MMVLVTLRRQKVCIALRGLTGYFSYINTELCLALFLKKIYIFFPCCGNDDFTNHVTCYGQCYGDLYSDTLFLPSFLEVFSAEILLLYVRNPAYAAGNARALSLRTESWVTVLTLPSSASVPHPKVSTVGYWPFGSSGYSYRGKKGHNTVSIVPSRSIQRNWCQGWWSRFLKSFSTSYSHWFGLCCAVALTASASLEAPRNGMTLEMSAWLQSQGDPVQKPGWC